MSNGLQQLRDELDGAVRDRATQVHVDAGAAWRDGQRRRRRGRVGATVVVVGAAAGALALAPALTGFPAALSPASGSHVTEHPARLDYTYWDDDQPAATGPLAGVVHRSSERHDGWYTVSPGGHLWRLDVTADYVPSVSPDGSHLAYMRGSFLGARYVIADQLDGTSVRFPQIGTGATDARTEHFDYRYFHSSQSPAFWSPDGTRVLTRVSLSNRDDAKQEPAAAVLGTDGSATIVPQPPGADGANPVGWIDDQHVAIASGMRSVPAKARVWLIDVRSGQATRRFDLRVGVRGAQSTSQWFASLSPDGTELATASLETNGTRFYSSTGPHAGELAGRSGVSPADACSPSWSSSGFYAPLDPAPDGGPTILARAGGGPTIIADPRLDIVCSTWARSALDGPAHRSLGARLFGQQDSWLSWHWRELTGSVLLGLSLLTGLWLLARSRAGRARRARA